MENNSEDPRNKQDQNRTNDPAAVSNQNETAPGSDSERRHKARNYKNGEEDIEGPDFDKESKAADGDSTVNAGIFK